MTTNCSNNCSPYQFPEKLIPLVIHNALVRKPLLIHCDGLKILDWLYVGNHCCAIRATLERGDNVEVCKIDGLNKKVNIKIARTLCKILDELRPVRANSKMLRYRDRITYVIDRQGHDCRYVIDATKIEKELNWCPAEFLETSIRKTFEWYLDNAECVEQVISGDHRHRIERQHA